MEGRYGKTPHMINARDRISRLPEPTLHHILSFLPTNRVVQTSVLSKRWRYVWKSIPTLNFDGDLFDEERGMDRIGQNRDFMNFVNWALISRGRSNVQKFRLTSSNWSCDSYSVISWIRFASMREVQELDLTFLPGKSFCLPTCIFTSKSLRTLNLNLKYEFFELPSFETFYSLETLSLETIRFIDDRIGDLISSFCPLLKNLNIQCCSGLKNLNISSKGLERLSLMFGMTDAINMSVKISAPSLRFLNWEGCIVNHYSIEDPTSILDAKLGFWFANVKNEWNWDSKSLVKLLHGLTNARDLLVSSYCLQALSWRMDLPNRLSTPLTNLNYLKLLLNPCTLVLPGVAYVLRSAPNLQNLVIISQFEPNMSKSSSDHGDEYLESQGMASVTLPNLQNLVVISQFEPNQTSKSSSDGEAAVTLFTHLEVVEMKCFQGSMIETTLLKFLLQNAMNLKKMIIFSSKDLHANSNKLKKISEMLLQVSKASPNVTLSFL